MLFGLDSHWITHIVTDFVAPRDWQMLASVLDRDLAPGNHLDVLERVRATRVLTD